MTLVSYSCRHVGDLGNVYADQNGTVSVIKRDFLVSLVGEYSVLGRAFVVRNKIDMLKNVSHLHTTCLETENSFHICTGTKLPPILEI